MVVTYEWIMPIPSEYSLPHLESTWDILRGLPYSRNLFNI